MKKVFLLLVLLAAPAILAASNFASRNQYKPGPFQIPARYTSSSQTDTIEWGCPILETIQAQTREDALSKIGKACMEDVRRAAVEKPGVFDVINVSVIWPDVQISPTPSGFHLEGTLFLETLVMKETVVE